ncbi:major facilitator superfamily domain-containing protein [Aspergillus minisclerotigenes]|uniref:Major facilitator superfamily domain-containing protein n=1 Tax=Aspergillus minisclerotigenes TaxID=656917 RepID=A0A5N6JAU8_9EURO|nr:major facilitator superfamily domain-containing protein [Aspergillus minisclerotigenes]
MGQATEPTKVPLWRQIFDQGFITQEVLNHNYKGAGSDESPYEVTWLENDSRNPMLLSAVFRWYLMFLVGMHTLAVALASSAYSGSIIEITQDLNISEEVALLGISLFVIGFAVGPLIWAPLSEIYGRRYIMIVCAVGLTAFTAGTAGSRNPWTLIILRFLGGSMGSGPFAVSGGVLADTFPAITRGLASGLYCAAPFLGPTLGPIIGGFLSQSAGWRWVEGLVAIFSALVGIAVFFTLPETYAPVLLEKRASRLSAITGKVYRSKLEVEKGKTSSTKILKMALSRPWVLLFREPIVLLLTIYLSIIYGILYLLFAAYPIVYQRERGWSEGMSGLAFLGILLGIVLSTIATFPNYYLYKKKALAANGRVPPEARLPPSFIGAICLPVGLFWFAWTNYPSVHWMASIAAGVPFGFGMVMVFLPVLNYLVDAYTIYAASVIAANASMRSIFGAAFPLFAGPMYNALGIHWASSLIAFLALACVPLPFLFYKYGPAIRSRCRYAAESERFMNALFAAGAQRPVEKAGEPQDREEGNNKSESQERVLGPTTTGRMSDPEASLDSLDNH